MDEDSQLMLRLRVGDAGALRRVYEKYKDDLLTVAVWIVGDRGAAEDCLHDVIVALATHAGRLHVQSSLRRYLVTSVANRARDQLRRKARWAAHAPLIGSDHETPEDLSSDPAFGMMQREEVHLLHLALAELPPEQRIVITLRLHGDLSFEEIAREEGVSNNTVRSRYRYGLDKLRSSLSTGVAR